MAVQRSPASWAAEPSRTRCPGPGPPLSLPTAAREGGGAAIDWFYRAQSLQSGSREGSVVCTVSVAGSGGGGSPCSALALGLKALGGGGEGSMAASGGWEAPPSTCPASSPGWALSCQTLDAWLGPHSCRFSSAYRCVGRCRVGWLDVAPPVPPGSKAGQSRIRNSDPALPLTVVQVPQGRVLPGSPLLGPASSSLLVAVGPVVPWLIWFGLVQFNQPFPHLHAYLHVGQVCKWHLAGHQLPQQHCEAPHVS